MDMFVSIFLLGLTFLEPNIDGVHRWLRLPLFTLNIAAIVIPITIVAIYRLIEEKNCDFGYRKFSCAFYGVWNFTYIRVLYFSHMVY